MGDEGSQSLTGTEALVKEEQGLQKKNMLSMKLKKCVCVHQKKKYLHFTTGWREMQALKQTFLTERIILLHITYSRRVFDGHFWVSTINNINLVEI